MSFVRSSSKSDPAIIKAYFKDALPAGGPRNAQARQANGVQYWSRNGQTPPNRLLINGVHVPFEEISADAPLAAKLGQAQAEIEKALKIAGASRAMASELAYLLCDGAFVDGDRKAVNQVLAGTATFGAPAWRELNVIVDGDGITVHRRSTWSKCEHQTTAEDKRTVAASNLLIIDSGVRFFGGRNKQGQVQISARPDYWVHSVAQGEEFAFIGGTLNAAPPGSTLWDRFVDALAWLVGARGIRFERTENLGKDQREFLKERRGTYALQPDLMLSAKRRHLTAIDLGTATIKTYRNTLPFVDVDPDIAEKINEYRKCHDDLALHAEDPKDDESIRQDKTNKKLALQKDAQELQAALLDPLIRTTADLLWSAKRSAESEFVKSIIGKPPGEATRLALTQDSILGLAIAVMVDMGRLRDEFEADLVKQSEDERKKAIDANSQEEYKANVKAYGADDILSYLSDGIYKQVASVTADDPHPERIHELLSEAYGLGNVIGSMLGKKSGPLANAGFANATHRLANAGTAMLDSMKSMRKTMKIAESIYQEYQKNKMNAAEGAEAELENEKIADSEIANSENARAKIEEPPAIPAPKTKMEQRKALKRWAETLAAASGAKASEVGKFDPVEYACMLTLCGVPITEIRAEFGQG